MSTCRSCGARIVWAVTTSNRRMPVDADPTPAGDLTLVYPSPAAAPIAVHADPGALLMDDPPRYVSHFATCPHADQHRRTHP